MTIDAHKNFAYSTVATAPSPATSGTSLVVAAGEGANFPATPFNAVVCPAGTQPTAANAEIIRVTARSTDTFSTIVRTREGTSARTIVAGDQIFVAVTAKTLTDVEDNVWRASDFGYLAWNFDTTGATGTSTIAAPGTVQTARLKLVVPLLITNVVLHVQVAGAGLTAGNNFAGLYQGGTLIGTTADQATNWQTGGPLPKVMALVGGPFAVAEGLIDIAFFYNGTTSPTFAVGATSSVGAHNAGLAAANSRFGTADTGRTTTLPATLGTIAAGPRAWWAAVS